VWSRTKAALSGSGRQRTGIAHSFGTGFGLNSLVYGLNSNNHNNINNRTAEGGACRRIGRTIQVDSATQAKNDSLCYDNVVYTCCSKDAAVVVVAIGPIGICPSEPREKLATPWPHYVACTGRPGMAVTGENPSSPKGPESGEQPERKSEVDEVGDMTKKWRSSTIYQCLIII